MTRSTKPWSISDQARTEARAAKKANLDARLQVNKKAITSGRKSPLEFMIFEDNLIAVEQARIAAFNKSRKFFQRKEPTALSAASLRNIADTVFASNVPYMRFMNDTQTAEYDRRNPRANALMNKLIARHNRI